MFLFIVFFWFVLVLLVFIRKREEVFVIVKKFFNKRITFFTNGNFIKTIVKVIVKEFKWSLATKTGVHNIKRIIFFFWLNKSRCRLRLILGGIWYLPLFYGWKGKIKIVKKKVYMGCSRDLPWATLKIKNNFFQIWIFSFARKETKESIEFLFLKTYPKRQNLEYDQCKNTMFLW